jgi:DNA-directed RNA polymerase II subunit RPB11
MISSSTPSTPFATDSMNAPERSACFLLDEESGEQKITYTSDTKVTNAGTFRFNKEDHTVGNLLRMQLHRDPNVRFVGYIHPHPLVHYVDMKIQTNTSTTDPKAVLSNAIEDLSGETDHLANQMQEAIEKWRKEHEDMI